VQHPGFDRDFVPGHAKGGSNRARRPSPMSAPRSARPATPPR
jgi:hypothetical protein